MEIVVVIPALNEAGNIGEVVREVLNQGITRVIVVDNGSTDDTRDNAQNAGALVISEPRRGYGYACAAGVHAAAHADVVVFMDGDGSFLASELPRLLEPIQSKVADLVLGSRILGNMDAGAMPLQQRFGNAVASFLIRCIYHLQITDLGPYRAVTRGLLDSLQMGEMTFGYPTEMLVKAARRNARIVEVPVTYHMRRTGESKVSGTLSGTILAGYRILTVTFRHSKISF